MFHFRFCFNPSFNRQSFNKLSLYSALWMTGASAVLLSHAIAPAAQADASFANEIRLAQAQFTTDQLPLSALSNSSELPYGTSVRGRLSARSTRHQGRLFSVYHFEGESGQLIRLNVVGERASARPPDRIQTGLWLVNPAVILLDSNGAIVAQQPEQTNAANALIRMSLPTTGTYHVFVTSTIIGGGGQYALTLQEIEQSR